MKYVDSVLWKKNHKCYCNFSKIKKLSVKLSIIILMLNNFAQKKKTGLNNTHVSNGLNCKLIHIKHALILPLT